MQRPQSQKPQINRAKMARKTTVTTTTTTTMTTTTTKMAWKTRRPIAFATLWTMEGKISLLKCQSSEAYIFQVFIRHDFTIC